MEAIPLVTNAAADVVRHSLAPGTAVLIHQLGLGQTAWGLMPVTIFLEKAWGITTVPTSQHSPNLDPYAQPVKGLSGTTQTKLHFSAFSVWESEFL